MCGLKQDLKQTVVLAQFGTGFTTKGQNNATVDTVGVNAAGSMV